MSVLIAYLLFSIMFLAGVLSKKYEFSVLSLFGLSNSFFFLVSPVDLESFPISKPTDLALVLLVISLAGTDRLKAAWKFFVNGPIGKMIVILGLLTVIFWGITVLRYGTSPILVFQVARLYYLYLACFVFSSMLSSAVARRRVLGVVVLMCSLVSIVYCLQTFLPPGTLIYSSNLRDTFTGYSFAGVVEFRLYLGYLDEYAAYAIALVLSLVLLGSKQNWAFLPLILLFFIQIVLTQHRNLWAVTIIGIIVCLLGLRTIAEKTALRQWWLAMTVFPLAIVVLSNMGIADLALERALEGAADTPLTGGTLTDRMLQSHNYLNILSENMFLGVGLLHYESGALGTTDRDFYISELGNISLFYHFGIAGVFLLFGLVGAVYRRALYLLRRVHLSRIDAAGVVAGLSFTIAVFLMSWINGAFVNPGGIVLLSFCWGYMEGIAIELADDPSRVKES